MDGLPVQARGRRTNLTRYVLASLCKMTVAFGEEDEGGASPKVGIIGMKHPKSKEFPKFTKLTHEYRAALNCSVDDFIFC